MAKQYISFLLILVFGISSCSSPEYPEFQNIKNIKLINFKGNNVKIGATAIVNNPNSLGGTVVDSDLKITLMGKHEANVKQVKKVVIPATNSFDLPFEFEFSPKEIWRSDLLGTAISLLGNKTIKTNIEGTVTVDLAGFEVDIPIDYETEIPLNKKKLEKREEDRIKKEVRTERKALRKAYKESKKEETETQTKYRYKNKQT